MNQVVGIIDYMRQYDIIKRMERMGKSVSMIAGQAQPTIVEPSLYKARFKQVTQTKKEKSAAETQMKTEMSTETKFQRQN